jgi:hypothetical protein
MKMKSQMKRRHISFALFFALFGLFAARSAAAGDAFHKLPVEKGASPSDLRIRIVDYRGNTNGAITVDVQNPTDKPQEFSARGLYFVPEGNADQAPQRLGAVGPFVLEGATGSERLERLTVPARATERVTLDVYCIDSHRSSPSSSTAFRVAKDRVPPALTRAINNDAAASASGLGGVSAPAAKSAVQSEVWKNRDKKWIELDGEGKQEAAKRR